VENRKLLAAYAFSNLIFAADADACVSTLAKLSNDEKLLKVIISGSRGISPEIIIKKWTCSICHGNYEKCSHNEGAYYHGQICETIASKIEFLGAALVDVPKDYRCRITDLLIVWEITKETIFEWYGFELSNENTRFKNIQKAHKQGLISQKFAFYLSECFSVQLYGKAEYTTSVLSSKQKSALVGKELAHIG